MALLFYTKGDEWTWHTLYVPYDDEYVRERYHYKDERSGRLFWPKAIGDLRALIRRRGRWKHDQRGSSGRAAAYRFKG